MIKPEDISVVLSEAELMAVIDELADRVAPAMQTGEWTAVSILIGATPFTTDFLKALARRGVHPMLDVIWLESYKDARESSGRISVRADISRPLKGRKALLIDDVYDTGRTLQFAKSHLLAKGAEEVLTCALTKKPWAPDEGLDFHAFVAPPKFLIGYGMDDKGYYRGLPFIGAVEY